MTTWEPSWPGRPTASTSLATRIGVLRAGKGWTQQQLADRVGITRVAVSHLEAAISSPDARTVTLLASAFGLEPVDLVAGTDYPSAKAERLPLVVARRTEVEHQVALMEADLAWLSEDSMGAALPRGRSDEVRTRWRTVLDKLAAEVHDPVERSLLDAARRRLADRS